MQKPEPGISTRCGADLSPQDLWRRHEGPGGLGGEMSWPVQAGSEKAQPEAMEGGQNECILSGQRRLAASVGTCRGDTVEAKKTSSEGARILGRVTRRPLGRMET